MISTHILDTCKGSPAVGVTVLLEKSSSQQWLTIGSHKTNTDGRVAFNCPNEAGIYRLTFNIEDYFQGQDSFFQNVPVVFHVKSIDRKYHIPLLLNPYGYTTYRGS